MNDGRRSERARLTMIAALALIFGGAGLPPSIDGVAPPYPFNCNLHIGSTRSTVTQPGVAPSRGGSTPAS
jgi:hypothetical protein